MRNYLLVFALFIIACASVLYFLSADISFAESRLRWMIFSYFSVLTLAFHYGVVRTTRERPQVFVRYFMAASTVKLLMHLGIIVFYALSNRAMAVKFIMTFMIMYFLFTAFEVLMLSVGKKAFKR